MDVFFRERKIVYHGVETLCHPRSRAEWSDQFIH